MKSKSQGTTGYICILQLSEPLLHRCPQETLSLSHLSGSSASPAKTGCLSGRSRLTGLGVPGPRTHFFHFPGKRRQAGSWVLARRPKPQGGHTLVTESAQGIPLERPPGHRLHTVAVTSAHCSFGYSVLHSPADGAPSLSPRSHKAGHPPLLLHCQQGTGPSPVGTLERSLKEKSIVPPPYSKEKLLSASTHTLSFSTEVFATAEGELSQRNADTHRTTRIWTLSRDHPPGAPEPHTVTASLPGGCRGRVPGQEPTPGEPQGSSLPASATSFSFSCISL